MNANVFSTWVGQYDRARRSISPVGRDLSPHDSRARLLVREHGVPLGLIEVPVAEGAIDSGLVAELSSRFPAVHPMAERADPAVSVADISVAICTRDRAARLAVALSDVQRLSGGVSEIIVIDNAPSNDETARLVGRRAETDARLRYVRADKPGLSAARNAAVAASTRPFVGFLDDDLRVDPLWARSMAMGFSDHRVGCVTGMVATAALDTPSQRYFDARVSWATRFKPQRFTREARSTALHPFDAGRFGTGANFTVRRELMQAVGGFDEALGTGTGSIGGEDLDAFARIILGGADIVYRPSALVWHTHPSDRDALERQLRGYGMGLGAYVGKLVASGHTFEVVRRIPAGVRRARHQVAAPLYPNGVVCQPGMGADDGAIDHLEARRLRRAELVGVARGVPAYFRTRREDRP